MCSKVCIKQQQSQYISEHGVFGTLHATKDRERLDPIRWWNMYGSGATYLHKLGVRVLSQLVNSSSAERCWSTYSVKRNSLNVEQAESLVYVHYNMRLLSHYYEATKNYRTFFTWDNNPEETNVEDGGIALERLEDELLVIMMVIQFIHQRYHPQPLAGFQMQEFCL